MIFPQMQEKWHTPRRLPFVAVICLILHVQDFIWPAAQKAAWYLRPSSHRTRSTSQQAQQIMEHIVVNGSVHTACKQHERVCMQMCLRVLCEWALNMQGRIQVLVTGSNGVLTPGGPWVQILLKIGYFSWTIARFWKNIGGKGARPPGTLDLPVIWIAQCSCKQSKGCGFNSPELWTNLQWKLHRFHKMCDLECFGCFTGSGGKHKGSKEPKLPQTERCYFLLDFLGFVIDLYRS